MGKMDIALAFSYYVAVDISIFVASYYDCSDKALFMMCSDFV